MKVLRTLSAHIALFLPLSRLRLQFLLLLEATSTADSRGAKVSVTLRWESDIKESFLRGNSILPGNMMLGGQSLSKAEKRGKESESHGDAQKDMYRRQWGEQCIWPAMAVCQL